MVACNTKCVIRTRNCMIYFNRFIFKNSLLVVSNAQISFIAVDDGPKVVFAANDNGVGGMGGWAVSLLQLHARAHTVPRVRPRPHLRVPGAGARRECPGRRPYLGATQPTAVPGGHGARGPWSARAAAAGSQHEADGKFWSKYS